MLTNFLYFTLFWYRFH